MSVQTVIQNKERSELHTEAHRLQNIYRQSIETYHEKIKSTFTSRQLFNPSQHYLNENRLDN